MFKLSFESLFEGFIILVVKRKEEDGELKDIILIFKKLCIKLVKLEKIKDDIK